MGARPRTPAEDVPATVLVTGYAKAPLGTAMQEVYRYAGIVLEIDPQTDTIVDAEFTFITDLARRYLRRLLVGYSLRQGLDPLVERICSHYFAPSQQAIIVALRAAVQRYQERSQRSASRA